MGKTALVTGASRGIGLTIARKLSTEGWTVAVNYNKSKKEAEALAREIGGLAVKAEVSDMKQVEGMFDYIEEHAGDIRLLVNNAGISSYGLFTELPPESWDQVFAVNVRGALNCCYRAIPGMIRRKSGNIINISSVWGQVGASCEAVYSASKAALIGFTKALAKELGPSGIRVNCVAPGCIDTDMLSEFTASELEAIKNETPLGVIGKPEDAAELVSFLASDKSGFITGQTLALNGGFAL